MATRHEKRAAKADEMRIAYEAYLKVKKEYEDVYYNAEDDKP
jgi:hypothetical protein